MVLSRLTNDKEFLRIPEVARILRLSRETVYKFIEDGLLPRYKVGGSVLIKIDDLLKFLDERHQTLKTKDKEEEK